jgi:hypothetical protein
MIAIWREKPESVDAAELESRIAALTYAAGVPYAPEWVTILDEISRRILRHPQLRRAPQYVALAFWLRRASIQRLADSLAAVELPGSLPSARGVALHLPPTNVDTIFVYSWALSLFAGNANVVRLPDALKPETGLLVSLLVGALEDLDDGGRQLFCHYPYGQPVEAALARHFDLRLIWGGDAKVAQVSRLPIRPDGLSIGFPDRKSIAVIATHAYGDADETERDALVERFFNDVYWFDQMGCGSPSLARAKAYGVEAGTSIGKLALAYDLLAEAVTDRHNAYGSALNVSRASDPAEALQRSHGGGFICDWVANRIEDLGPLATRSLQTVTHFGIDATECETLAKTLRGRGGYRVVPIGQALQFEPVWDGVDLMRHMTRAIVWR